MALTIVNKNKAGRLRIVLKGRFDFQSHIEFRKAYEKKLGIEGKGCLEIDFLDVDYIDSAALGMLLLMKEKAEKVRCDIILVNCRGKIKEIFECVNFSKEFKIQRG